MEQNKVRSYFLYAIGEIVLVMIGILLALQVNNWNEERRLLSSAEDHLQILENNLNDDLIQLLDIKEELEISLESSIKLVERFKRNLDADAQDIMFEITQLIFEYSYSPEKSGLDILVNSGELGVLSNSLRNQISLYYNGVENMQERDEISNTFIKNQYEMFILDKYASFWSRENPHPALSIYSDDKRNLEKIDPIKVLNDKRLETLIFARNFQLERQIAAYNEGATRLQRLMDTLETR